MEKLFIPAVNLDSGLFNVQDPTQMGINVLYHNVVPIKTKEDQWSLAQRPTFTLHVDDSVTNGYGRGIMEKNTKILRVDQGFYHYGSTGDGLSASITGDTSFNTKYLAAMTMYNQAGVDWVIIQNAGSNTTDAAKGNLYYAVDEDTAPVRVTDTDMPGADGNPTIRGAVSLDGYLFVANIFGEIHNCDLDDVTSWASTAIITAERNASPGAYLAKHRDHVVFLGADNTEFFYNAAEPAPASPLARRRDIFYNIGCQDVNTVVESGDLIIFVGVDKAGQAGVYQLKDFNLTKISSPLMDTICSRSGFSNRGFADADYSGSIASLVNVPNSGLFYVVTFDGSSTQSQGTYAMHLETGFVSKWYTGSSPTNKGTTAAWDTSFLLPLCDSTGIAGDNPTNNNIYMLYNGTTARLETFEDGATTNNLTDIGLTAPWCGYYTHPIDMDTNNRKKIRALRLSHHPSVDDSIDPSNVIIAHKNLDTLEAGGFDIDSFPTGRTIDISKNIGRIYRGGIFRQRMYEVEITPNKRQIIKGLELEYEILRG